MEEGRSLRLDEGLIKGRKDEERKLGNAEGGRPAADGGALRLRLEAKARDEARRTMEAKPMEDGRRARLIGIRHIEMLIGLLYI